MVCLRTVFCLHGGEGLVTLVHRLRRARVIVDVMILLGVFLTE
jgi:hypothetical protein